MIHPEFIEAFGLRVKKLRAEKELSQQQLANLSEIDIRTIQRVEQCNFNPSLDIVYCISLGFKMNISELLDFSVKAR